MIAVKAEVARIFEVELELLHVVEGSYRGPRSIMSTLLLLKKVTRKSAYESFPLEVLVRRAKSNDMLAQAILLERFELLLAKSCSCAAAVLPGECREVLKAEAKFLFLVLLGEFDPKRGVPFEGYVKAKLERRLVNWCHAERTRSYRNADFNEEDFENSTCAAWMLSDENVKTWGGGVKEELAKLPERQRLVVCWWAQGHSEREIGKRLEISGVRVHQLKKRALETLRAALK